MPTETITLTDSAAMTLSMPTATPEMTAIAAAQPALEVTSEPAADAQAERSAAPVVEQPAIPATVPPTIDPLRVIEIAVLALAVMLGIATLIVRRLLHNLRLKRHPNLPLMRKPNDLRRRLSSSPLPQRLRP